MSNQYLPEDYKPKGLLYKLPVVGDAIKDALIPQDVQERRARKANEDKMLAEGVTTGFNDRLLDDMRASELTGANYQPLETEELSFGANLLSVVKNEEGTQFIPKHKEFIGALFGDLPLLNTTQTVGGTTEDFRVTDAVYNQNTNTVFVVGENYKGDMAPKTVMQSDKEGDQIAEYTLSDWNELAKVAYEYKRINSNYKPGYLSNAREDVEAMADNVYTNIAMGVKEAYENGLLDDPDNLNQFNEGIAAMLADQQDPEQVAKQDDQIPGIALTEMRPEIAKLVGPPDPNSKEGQAAYEMVEGSSLSEEDQNAMIAAWNNMNTGEKVSLLSTGLLVIPGIGAATYAGVRAIAFGAGVLSRANISTKLLNFVKSAVTKPKKESLAVAKSGNKFPTGSPQGQQIVKAGEADLKKRSTIDKVKDFGSGNTGNPRVVTEQVKDTAGNVVREFAPGRAAGVGLVGTSVGGNIAGGIIQGELDEMDDATDMTGTGPAVELEPVNIPKFKSAQEAATWFQDENNYANFVASATNEGAQNIAAKLEEAFATLGINDAQSFTTNIEEIKARINPGNDFNTNQTLAALIAERSGGVKETQATLFNQTLTALTSSDRLGFEVAKERRSIQSQSLTEFTDYYLKDFDTSGEIQEINDLFITNEDGTSFDELQGQMLLQRKKFAGKYPELFPEYVMTANGPVNKKRAQIIANGAKRGLNSTQQTNLENNLNQIEKLERAQTNQTVKTLVNKYEGKTSWFESIRNLFANRNPFANPEDDIFPYMQVEVNQRKDGSYDPVRFIVRQPGNTGGARTNVVIEDQEFNREFGNSDSQYQMSFYANLGKQNIKVLNK